MVPDNPVVLISGGSAGVGAATARLFAAQGARLVLAARREEPLHRLAREITTPERVLTVACDLADRQACQALVAAAIERFGRIDVLVNNAGCNYRGDVDTRTHEELGAIVDLNLRAPIMLTNLVLPRMKRQGSGAIVNVASLAGHIPLPHEATYSATKFGLRAFTFALREELHGSAISASVVSPGPIATGFILDKLDEVPDTVFSQPVSSAEDVARAVIACAHDGRRERSIPGRSGRLATLGYLIPSLYRWLRPALERKGRAARERLRELAPPAQ